MKHKLTRILTSLMIMLGLALPVSPAFAAGPVDVFKGDACNGNTSVCGGNNNQLFNIIKNVINTMLYAAGIIAVIMVIVGGIRYVLSSGDNSNIASAKNTILYAVIGLGIAMLAFAIVNFVLDNIF